MTVIRIGATKLPFLSTPRGLLVLGCKPVHYHLKHWWQIWPHTVATCSGEINHRHLYIDSEVIWGSVYGLLFSILLKDMLRSRDLVSNQLPLHHQGNLLWSAGSFSVTENVKLL